MDDKICLLYTDISRAYFHAPAKDEKYIELPGEEWGNDHPRECGRLLVSLYGTRDAAHNWEEAYAGALIKAGFIRGVGGPCMLAHKTRALKLLVHGDDFVYVPVHYNRSTG